MRRSWGVFAFTVAGAAFVAAPAGAQDHPSFDIPLETVERGEEGSELLLGTETVPAEDTGRECDVVAESANNHSVHPNTDLLVRSGDSEVEVLDVEQESDGTIEATDTLVLDTEVSVFVRFGPDEVFSGGLVVTLDCPTPPPTTTVPSSPTTTVTTVPPEVAPPAAEIPPAQPVVGPPTFTG